MKAWPTWIKWSSKSVNRRRTKKKSKDDLSRATRNSNDQECALA